MHALSQHNVGAIAADRKQAIHQRCEINQTCAFDEFSEIETLFFLNALVLAGS